MMPDQKTPTTRRSAAHRAGAPRWVGFAVAAAVAVATAVVAGVLLWAPFDVRTVEVGGVSYRTNIELREDATGIYAFMPVNTDTDGVVLEMDDDAADPVIRDFLERLDTFVPGEHVLELENSVTIRVIVDGVQGVDEVGVIDQLDDDDR